MHRDLKPANTKIANNDAVKLLDFGLAKALEGEPASTDISSSPTISRMATQAAIILGTAAYMWPGQAKGKPVDRRTDIWAFSCVPYEAIAGVQAQPAISADGSPVAYIVRASREDDTNAELWGDDFKSPRRQIFRGWVLWFVRGPQDRIYLPEGRRDLSGVFGKVGWDGKELEPSTVTIPIARSYWVDPAQNSLDSFDVFPDGHNLAFENRRSSARISV